jgi:hypothetical protein
MGEGRGEGDFRNHPGEFVAEDGGRDDHLGVVAALENFQVGAAGERGLDADADFAGLERRRRNFLDEDFFFSVEDGGFHGRSVGAAMTGLNFNWMRRSGMGVSPVRSGKNKASCWQTI